MAHYIENHGSGEDRVTFNVACEYPDGKRVLWAGTSMCATAGSFGIQACGTGTIKRAA